MYRKMSKGWLKHWDFELGDLISIELAFFLSYFLRHRLIIQSTVEWYTKLGIIMLVIQCIVMMFGNNYKGIIQRGYIQELWATIQHVTVVEGLFIVYEFLMKETMNLSRFVVFVSWGLGIIFCYGARIGIKTYAIRRLTSDKHQAKMLVVTTKDRVVGCMAQILSKKIRDYRVVCIAFPEEERSDEHTK